MFEWCSLSFAESKSRPWCVSNPAFPVPSLAVLRCQVLLRTTTREPTSARTAPLCAISFTPAHPAHPAMRGVEALLRTRRHAASMSCLRCCIDALSPAVRRRDARKQEDAVSARLATADANERDVMGAGCTQCSGQWSGARYAASVGSPKGAGRRRPSPSHVKAPAILRAGRPRPALVMKAPGAVEQSVAAGSTYARRRRCGKLCHAYVGVRAVRSQK